jgi:transposase
MLIADKAYAHDSTRAELRRRGIAHTIPERSDQLARRAAKGSHGGRPPTFDKGIYRERNQVERCFNRLKHWRGLAPATPNGPASTGPAWSSSPL